MSLFIKPENQQLLWKTIHKTPLIDDYFRNYPPGSREKWFQDIIRSFHINNSSITSSEGLARTNRDVIAYMVLTLRRTSNSCSVSSTNSTPSIASHLIQSSPTTLYSRNQDIAKDVFAEKYTNRQKEYESMLQKPQIPEVQFSEKMEDGVIENIEELVKQQLRQRELDIANYAPPGPIGIPSSTPMNLSTPVSSSSYSPYKKLSISQEDSHIESISLNRVNSSPIEISQKKVTFSLSNNETGITNGVEIENERILVLENRVRELEKIVEKMMLQSDPKRTNKETDKESIE
jgi:hypothetical protein